MANEKKQTPTEPKAVSFGDEAQKRGTIVRVVIITLSAVLIVIGIIGILAMLWR